MAGWLKKKAKTPSEMALALQTAVMSLRGIDAGDKHLEKATEESVEILERVVVLLYGDAENPVQPDVVSSFAAEIYSHEVLLSLVGSLPYMSNDCRRHAQQVWSGLLKRQVGTRFPTVEHICDQGTILSTLVNGYLTTVSALSCGQMLREACEYEALNAALISQNLVYAMFEHLESQSFEVQADAFLTFKTMITRHPVMSAAFLESNYDQMFEVHYEQLVKSGNYLTRRQSLKLLSELLLDRQNYNVMQKYISVPAHLKCVMGLLRDKSRNIQFEAFHVFKVFVANPNKPPEIRSILQRNQAKLVEYLSTFHDDRDQDEQFMEERAFLIREIDSLKPVDGE